MKKKKQEELVPLRVVMLEFINDLNEWSWYSITRNDTPRRAIKRYLKEYGLDDEIIRTEKDPDLCIVGKNEVLYAENTDIRAYYIDI